MSSLGIHVEVFVWTYVFIFLDKYLVVERLGHMVSGYFTL